ncbi:NAD(P)/FAD-dependent oxidoreductase [Xanthobacter autotrophicus]|uniref:NAD(P)/FAD-dependent oxidoreductase n=1 Tax=Xanthobacter TaxID=279 RepID=UPI0024ABC571|nr:NAD(P)/FAD-dependent oxidoreductase [Xanthobacter autotrophicus]MDI4663090.1 NAD(P)/FAD-dependent oxidoreductase [Xanthobacter autotrophicus]
MTVSRRHFLAAAGLAVLPLGAPAVLGQGKPRLVVVGGGAGGATAARYVAKDSAGAIEVTLVEPNRTYVTCFHSNLFLGGFRSFDSLLHGYEGLAKDGVRLVHEAASAIDRDRREVVLASGGRLPYDRLILSPGIDLNYGSVPGWSKEAEDIMPHAWKAGPQTKLLKAKLDQVPDGGLIVMIAPPNPYRCPPGPYERVSMMAHVLKTTGRGRAKIIVIDPKQKFSKQGLFQEGWEKHYSGMVEWMAPDISDGLKSVDPKTSTVVTGFETYRDAALVNVIPAQMAGAIARQAELADASGWCPIDPDSMASRMEAAIFVIGDAAIPGDMPKSAFAANSQAKVAAMKARADLIGARAFPARYANTCWSLIAPDDAVKVGGRYAPADGKIREVEGFISKTGEPPELRRATQGENMGWYAAITADIFG